MRVLVVGASVERAEELRAALRDAGHEVVTEELYADIAVMDIAEVQALKSELAEVKLKLEERKLVERAKGLLMKSRGLDEEAAYGALRKMAMDRNLRLGEAARRVLEAADVLG